MDVRFLTISQVKKDLKDKKYSAVELTKEYLGRIKKSEPGINAFVTVSEKEALEHASTADKLIGENQDLPLLGIPFSIKDNFCTKDIRTTASSFVLEDYVAQYSATVVENLFQSGAVILGKTNLDAWAHGSSTETSDFGSTKNPWDTTRLPGGSSGGAAASVAADEALIAIGTETAGSIRLPAGWCGVVGFKPTYGRVSRFGVISMGSSLDSPGPLTKTVEDAALVLEVIAGNDPNDATTALDPVKKYSQLMLEKRKLVIGVADDYFTGVDPEIVKSVEEALKLLEKKGHTIKKIKLFDPQYAIDVYTILQRSEVSSNLARFDGIRYGFDRSYFGDEAKRRIMLGTYALSSGYYDAYYKKAQKVRTLIINDFNNAFSEVDVIVAPTTPGVAPKLGATANEPMFGEKADMLMEPSSIAGICGISVPAGFSKGLPVGMQIIGKQFDEETILSLAHEYESETQFWKQKPANL